MKREIYSNVKLCGGRCELVSPNRQVLEHDLIMPERLRGQYLAGVLAVGFTVFYFAAQSWGREPVLVSTDVLFMVVSGSCALLGLLAVRELGFRESLGLFTWVFFWQSFSGSLERLVGEFTRSFFMLKFRILRWLTFSISPATFQPP